MNAITADFLQRLTKEAKITVAGLRESVLAIAERVNRKTQTLRLHWQASTLIRQMENVSRSAGQTLCDLVAPRHTIDTPTSMTPATADARLLEAATTARSIKQELMHIEETIRELEVEVLHEDLIKIQQDLTSRSAGLARFVVAPGSSAVGLSLVQLNLPETTRAAALLRGPTLLSSSAEVPIRVGDILILIGPQAELPGIGTRFINRSENELNKSETRIVP
jgi:uncharacterized protein with PhoU and TrkA domain